MFEFFSGFSVVSWIVFSLLIILSTVSWFLIYVKSLMTFILSREFRRVSLKWREFSGFSQISSFAHNDQSLLVKMLVAALFEWPKINMAPITDLQKSELLTAVFNRETTRIRMLLDRGQTMLAVIAAVSPLIAVITAGPRLLAGFTEVPVKCMPKI